MIWGCSGSNDGGKDEANDLGALNMYSMYIYGHSSGHENTLFLETTVNGLKHRTANPLMELEERNEPAICLDNKTGQSAGCILGIHYDEKEL